jgi:hypothetical protein
MTIEASAPGEFEDSHISNSTVNEVEVTSERVVQTKRTSSATCVLMTG